MPPTAEPRPIHESQASELGRLPSFPSLLFHTTLSISLDDGKPSGPFRIVFPLGTHATLKAAKTFASGALKQLGYDESDFEVYETRLNTDNEDTDSSSWPYGDGILIHAKRTGSHEFLVGISTTTNNSVLPTRDDDPSEIQLPHGSDHLYYIIQTKIDYAVDHSTGVESSDIEGVYLSRLEAITAAKKCLISDEIKKEDYTEYDEFDDDSFKDQWPFRDDVVVHAVSSVGENFLVAVRTVLDTHAHIFQM
jgi:hypothetical protein